MIDLVIVGGGPAGMSAAIEAYEKGIKDILIIDREEQLGGILKQCIHNGFGLHRYKEELTGPEYAWKNEKKILEYKIPYKLNTTVLSINKQKEITYTNELEGIVKIQAKAIILAMGCRERNRGSIEIAGERCAGIYAAGTAQKLVNIKGYLPGKKVVILGSGDIGLIMARRLTLEGAKVEAVCELMPYSSGLSRNIEQCLNDFNIPLYLSTTVVEVVGKDRVEGVNIVKVDENKKPILETKRFIECDTLLLSVGLIPENELTKQIGVRMDPNSKGAYVDQNRETTVEGIFACGNVLHVHDLVDYVSEESVITSQGVLSYLKNENRNKKNIEIEKDDKITYTVPHYISEEKDFKLFFRVKQRYENCRINIYKDDVLITSKKKLVLTPGEMETLLIKKEMLLNAKKISIKLEVIYD